MGSELDVSEEYMTVNGSKIRVIRQSVESAALPTLFLVHSAGARADVWKELIRYYYKRLAVVAPDLLGHGKSEFSDRPADYTHECLVDMLEGVFRRYSTRLNLVVAHGYGCALVASLYPRIRDYVTACVFLGPLADIPPSPSPLASSANSAEEHVSKPADKNTPNHLPQVLEWMREGSQPIAVEDFASVHVPVCVIVGLADKIAPPSLAREIMHTYDQISPQTGTKQSDDAGTNTKTTSTTFYASDQKNCHSGSLEKPPSSSSQHLLVAQSMEDFLSADRRLRKVSEEPDCDDLPFDKTIIDYEIPSDPKPTTQPHAQTHDQQTSTTAETSDQPGSSTNSNSVRSDSLEVGEVSAEKGIVVEMHELAGAGHQLLGEKKDVINALVNRFFIEGVGLVVLDRMHRLNRGDSIHDKWCLKNYEKWITTANCGSLLPVGPVHGLVPMKVLRQDDETHSPAAFMATHPNVGVILDLTSQAPPYDVKDPSIPEYIKLSTISKKIPDRDYVCEFNQTVQGYWARQPERDIAVHCHYGFNRTGFMVASYLVECHGYSVEDAITAFCKSRPKGIRHQHFIDELYLRYESDRAR